MKKINPECSDYDSFKYSILISLYYYCIPFHHERISKVKVYEKLFDFSSLVPSEFEDNNSVISLNICDKNLKQIYTSKNNSPQIANIMYTNNRYAVLKDTKISYEEECNQIKKYIIKELIL